jgi:hypothetical protein
MMLVESSLRVIGVGLFTENANVTLAFVDDVLLTDEIASWQLDG